MRKLFASGLELDGESVEAEGAEEVAAHSALDGVEASDGRLDPVEADGVGEALEVGFFVDIAETLGGAGLEEEDVFEEAGEGAKEGGGLGVAVGAGAVGLGHAEEGGVFG